MYKLINIEFLITEQFVYFIVTVYERINIPYMFFLDISRSIKNNWRPLTTNTSANKNDQQVVTSSTTLDTNEKPKLENLGISKEATAEQKY